MFLKISQNLQENNCVAVSFSVNTSTQVFSCKILKPLSFFIEHQRWLLLNNQEFQYSWNNWRIDLCNLKECLVTEIMVRGENCFFQVLWVTKSDSRWIGKLLYGLWYILRNAYYLSAEIITSNFNDKSAKWRKLDKDDFEGPNLYIKS